MGPLADRAVTPLRDIPCFGKQLRKNFFIQERLSSHDTIQPLTGNYFSIHVKWASLVAQTVKNLPTVQETWIRSLGLKDSLEKEMATHSTILALRILWTEVPGGLQSMGLQRVGHK